MPAASFKVTELFGFPVILDDKTTVLNYVMALLNAAEVLPAQQAVTLNPEMLMQGEQNPELGSVLKQADIVIPDGAGLVWALRKQGLKVKRLPGIEFAEALLELAVQHQWPVALLGASPDVNEATVSQLQQRFKSQQLPKLPVVYAQHGFFDKAQSDEIAQACANTKPKLVFVALGVPGQELWIKKYRHLFKNAILMGVGGSFDVWSGTKQRAPEIFLKTHTEWLYRITSEPWRIKRVCKTLPQFALRVLFSA